MKVEELLIDRYIVTAPYPQSKFEVGDILYVYKFETSSLGMYTYVTNPESPLQGSNAKPEYVESMPHLFRKLNWWEERKVEDMPEYVSYISLTKKDKYGDDETKTRIYIKVHKWRFGNSLIGISSNDPQWYYHSENDHWGNDLCHSQLPATEQQYNDYINSKINAKP